eukprot:TRINITY_DN37686_c0_g1_i2.p2 TRINITY_DN37686_c0_g1~~TRINITY_DN37686_c0_g1_i2.p2  ORF type:complete len:190 (-),score=17.87 TRINITY_DN37686_c0_g1_i2:614-1183(-)
MDKDWPCKNQNLQTLEILSWSYVHDQHLVHTKAWIPELASYFSKLYPNNEALVKECIRSPWRSLDGVSWDYDSTRTNVTQADFYKKKRFTQSSKKVNTSKGKEQGKSVRVSIMPRKDSPFWFTSVNRVNWPEYQQFMSGFAWTVPRTSKNTEGIVDKNNDTFSYPLYPIVAPLDLEVDLAKIPIDHSWG